MSGLNSKALVGHWNAEADGVSKTAFLDRGKAFRDSSYEGDPIKVAKTDFVRRIEEEPFIDYDKAMISLLYCKAIKPGMDKLEAIKTLWLYPECFKNLKRWRNKMTTVNAHIDS